MVNARKVRWGVIGATARVARDFTIPAIMSGEYAELIAVASRNLASAQEVAGECGACRAYGDYDSLLADCDVDAVYIPLPNSLHVGWAIEAMNNGKHVLCEEPIAVTAAEALEMMETAQENGVLLAEAMMYHYHPLQYAVKEIIGRGEIGDVVAVKASISFIQNDPDDYRRDPRMGGGALLDVGCYGVHIARKIFGSEPVTVTGHSTIDEKTGVDTTTAAQLEFEGGTAEIVCSFSLAAQSTYRVTGTSGSIEVPLAFLPKDEAGHFIVQRVGSEATVHTVDAADMFRAEIDMFSRAALGLPSELLGPEDAVANMVVLDAIASAARTDRLATIAE